MDIRPSGAHIDYKRFRMLEKECFFFNSHRQEYLREHAGVVTVIENEALVGFFPDQNAALVAMRDYVLGSFLVKKVIPAD